MDLKRLWRQIEFLVEIDRLKSIVRQTLLVDGSRQEDSAEHSWHLAVLAMVLAEHSRAPVDLFRVLKMILVHDLVEIDAGDTYCYDEEANREQGGAGEKGGRPNFQSSARRPGHRVSLPMGGVRIKADARTRFSPPPWTGFSRF